MAGDVADLFLEVCVSGSETVLIQNLVGCGLRGFYGTSDPHLKWTPYLHRQ